MILISPETLSANRGISFISLITAALRQISPTATEQQMKSLIIPVFVNYKAKQPKNLESEMNKIIKMITKKFIDKDPECINTLESA